MVERAQAGVPPTSLVMTVLVRLLVNSYTKQHMQIKKQYDPNNQNSVINFLSLLSPLQC